MDMFAAPPRFADDVRRGLLATPKQLDPRYLYDALGSHLFESICKLPWYPLTRAESALLERHAADMVAPFRDGATLLELGCGCGEKLSMLCEPLSARGSPVDVQLIDISEAALDLSKRTLARFSVDITAHRATYEEGLQRAATCRKPGTPVVVLFLGSNIGNLDPTGAHHLLTTIRAALQPGDALLLGADLVKPQDELLRAYDDPLGVTAAFNKNLLVRMNRELGADFDLSTFAHEARWNAEASRVEMHLISQCRQRVRLPGAATEVSFEEGESIWTESSHKYTPESIAALAECAGFQCTKQWIEPHARFSTSLLMVDAPLPAA
ncbi:L-histidine N(alpha)-methyltransferase [Chondromyces crocatus]|uniref:Methyltransferase n=1 Tax=Chondromyces crocatus TaxID=52 RepID=A0A0K1ECR3_CHOCO|nr:L-histidine N(alpha)-methyltransferase [Chondromyces crocatus]AKT38368.1 methyltransferase [Chondromyces crocatus]